jgi:FkbM family methyltransferase
MLPCRMKLIVWHIGGGGEDLGPVEQLFRLSGIEIEIFLFEIREIRESSANNFITVSKRKNHVLNTITIGVAGKSGTANFFEHEWELTSSLLETSSLSSLNNPGYSRWKGEFLNFNTWSDITKLKSIKKVQVSTINELIVRYKLPAPDVISLDIQGLELEVLQSGEDIISEVAAIITESEFFEIYAKQALFHEQLSYLEKHSFRFVKFFGFQKWHPGPLVGLGFTTVTESLFIKYLVNSEENEKTSRKFNTFSSYSSELKLKIAIISFAYKRYSYFYTLIKNIKESDHDFWKSMSNDKNLEVYINYFLKIENNIGKLINDKNFFTQNPIEVSPKLYLFRKVFFSISEKFLSLFHIRGLVLKANQFKGLEQEMD